MIGENFGMIDFRQRGINIDTTFRCTLECPSCMRADYKRKNMKIPGRDMPLNDFYKIADFFKSVQFCGQISDPIFNPNLIEMLRYCYVNNIPVLVNTAASQRKKHWYEKAYRANPKARWIFGIDGLPKDSHKYRIHQNGEHLFEMMKLGAQMGVEVAWQYLVFNYNENDIETARNMAKANNIYFKLTFSGRWTDTMLPYKPNNPKNYINSDRKMKNETIS